MMSVEIFENNCSSIKLALSWSCLYADVTWDSFLSLDNGMLSVNLLFELELLLNYET